ncbi:MAG: DUF3168 domain-containing protein [Methylorubrum extorquens]|uniref:DUF3168 domain-containing protein n=2 Tax=Methylorubrum extorquens TaxID=408 RepID=C7CKW5_METED|nr:MULTISPECIES: DUF3168 domain-containing protein [Methylorubrum]ARO55242.1 hypothetical protein B2G69_14755 [Methylorubrum zatmanii]CAX23667.1 conserved protein of unknown function [Methylorubrum extorquens DM4]SOR31194.1 conserved protein of unknown function [Methylorubrum extorquens]
MTRSSPLLALRAGLLAHLAADTPLAALMGGRLRLYDEPPRGAAPVYALFGPSEVSDDSVDGAQRHRHAFALTVFAKPGSARSALEVAERIAARLDEADLAVSGHALVLLRLKSLAGLRDERTGEARATLSFEAVTEVAA